MKDGIIKADGTSRFARSVADFKTKYPTYDDFANALVAGTLPLDILFHAEGWAQQPDFLNKASLLKDATAALYGLGSDAVPDDALVKLSGAKPIAVGYYMGSGGNSTEENPFKLTFGFSPVVVNIWRGVIDQYGYVVDNTVWWGIHYQQFTSYGGTGSSWKSRDVYYNSSQKYARLMWRFVNDGIELYSNDSVQDSSVCMNIPNTGYLYVALAASL